MKNFGTARDFRESSAELQRVTPRRAECREFNASCRELSRVTRRALHELLRVPLWGNSPQLAILTSQYNLATGEPCSSGIAVGKTFRRRKLGVMKTNFEGLWYEIGATDNVLKMHLMKKKAPIRHKVNFTYNLKERRGVINVCSIS